MEKAQYLSFNFCSNKRGHWTSIAISIVINIVNTIKKRSCATVTCREHYLIYQNVYSLCNPNLPEIRTGESVTITAWCEHKVKYLGGYSSGTYRYGTLTEAQTECLKRNGTVSSLVILIY